MDDLFVRYYKERENADVLQTYGAFMIYKLKDDHCFINDCYVVPELRKKGVGKSFIDTIKKICGRNKINIIFCQMDEEANGSDIAKEVIESVGFKKCAKSGTVTTFYMEVTNG